MRRLSAAFLIAVLGFALVAVLLPTGAVDRLELLTLDARYASGVGRRPPGDDIVVAWIDQESMDYLDQNGVPFPWPREIYAQVLGFLIDAGARAVAFDALFDQRGNAEDDRVFGEALAASTGDVLAMNGADIEPIMARLAELQDRVIGASTQTVAQSREVTILADKEVPFIVVKQVMSTCTAQGYERISLAVVQKQSATGPATTQI